MAKQYFELSISQETYDQWIDTDILDQNVEIVIQNLKERMLVISHEVINKKDPRFIEHEKSMERTRVLVRLVLVDIVNTEDFVESEKPRYS